MNDELEKALVEIENIILNGDPGYDEYATSMRVLKIAEKYVRAQNENEEYENRDNESGNLKEEFRAAFTQNYMAFMHDEFGDGIEEVMWMAFCHGVYHSD